MVGRGQLAKIVGGYHIMGPIQWHWGQFYLGSIWVNFRGQRQSVGRAQQFSAYPTPQQETLYGLLLIPLIRLIYHTTYKYIFY